MPNSEPISIPVQNLHAISPPIDEEKERARKRIMLQRIRDQTRETIKPFSHIGRMQSDEDTGLRSNGQYDSPLEAVSIAAMSCVN